MTAWLALTCAILSEVVGTLALRTASAGRPIFYGPVLAAYALSFVFLSLTLRGGIGIGVAYGVWTASGVAAIALASRLLFQEVLSRRRMVGITLIAAGVLLVELGGSR